GSITAALSGQPPCLRSNRGVSHTSRSWRGTVQSADHASKWTWSSGYATVQAAACSSRHRGSPFSALIDAASRMGNVVGPLRLAFVAEFIATVIAAPRVLRPQTPRRAVATGFVGCYGLFAGRKALDTAYYNASPRVRLD